MVVNTINKVKRTRRNTVNGKKWQELWSNEKRKEEDGNEVESTSSEDHTKNLEESSLLEIDELVLHPFVIWKKQKPIEDVEDLETLKKREMKPQKLADASATGNPSKQRLQATAVQAIVHAGRTNEAIRSHEAFSFLLLSPFFLQNPMNTMNKKTNG